MGLFAENPSIKFRENPSSGSRFVSCRQTYERTDIKEPVVAFRNFANTPKIYKLILWA
jgi:hypothetical protein